MEDYLSKDFYDTTEKIINLQTLLREYGYMKGGKKYKPTGIFDSETEAALQEVKMDSEVALIRGKMLSPRSGRGYGFFMVTAKDYNERITFTKENYYKAHGYEKYKELESVAAKSYKLASDHADCIILIPSFAEPSLSYKSILGIKEPIYKDAEKTLKDHEKHDYFITKEKYLSILYSPKTTLELSEAFPDILKKGYSMRNLVLVRDPEMVKRLERSKNIPAFKKSIEDCKEKPILHASAKAPHKKTENPKKELEDKTLEKASIPTDIIKLTPTEKLDTSTPELPKLKKFSIKKSKRSTGCISTDEWEAFVEKVSDLAEDGILDKDDLLEIDLYKSKINGRFTADQIKTITSGDTIEYYLHSCWQGKENGGKVKAEFER